MNETTCFSFERLKNFEQKRPLSYFGSDAYLFFNLEKCSFGARATDVMLWRSQKITMKPNTIFERWEDRKGNEENTNAKSKFDN